MAKTAFSFCSKIWLMHSFLEELLFGISRVFIHSDIAVGILILRKKDKTFKLFKGLKGSFLLKNFI